MVATGLAPVRAPSVNPLLMPAARATPSTRRESACVAGKFVKQRG
jgi:hypothetical protein